MAITNGHTQQQGFEKDGPWNLERRDCYKYKKKTCRYSSAAGKWYAAVVKTTAGTDQGRHGSSEQNRGQCSSGPDENWIWL
jgi:hypothetical protein